jgi:hypothetical protein
MARPQQIPLCSLPCPHQIPQRLVHLIRNPYRRQLATTQQCGQALGIAPIRLDAIAWTDWNKSWSHDFAEYT